MMKFTTEPQKPAPMRYVRRVGPITIMVDEPDGDDRTWKHYQLSKGFFTDATPEECFRTWPREVVGLLREAADQLEAQIREEEEQTYEADLERGEINGRTPQA